MKRRTFIVASGAVALAGAGYALLRFSPEQGFFQSCHAILPPEVARDPAIAAAWDGLDPSKMWDCHVHLVGVGDGGSGIWINPRMNSLLNPWEYVQRLFYLNAGCAHDAPGRVDQTFVERMENLVDGLRPGVKLMLLALDQYHTEAGVADRDRTSIYTPNAYAARMAQDHPRYFEWIASVHPYRGDCIEALEWAAQQGARAVKWLPAAQGIDPASPRCERFYDALARLGLPLLTHAGGEWAVSTPGGDALGNPLRLRSPLERGVKVIVAHCASLGDDQDLDRGPNGPYVPSIELFARLMAEPRYESRLFADISGVAQVNRARHLTTILERSEWHSRLLNGSDYPLPGVMPLFSVNQLADLGVIDPGLRPLLREVREANPLLFDLLVKRNLRWRGRSLPASVFETRPFFENVTGARSENSSPSTVSLR
jgi:mannonate dehydratase